MITLYQFATSPFADKVRRALAFKGLDYAIEEVVRAEVAGGRYAKVSPTGKFPAIEHDGHAVCDSTDIVLHLDAAFPDRPLLPQEPRQAALAHILEDWADESLYFYEMTMRLTWPHNLEAGLDEFAAGMPGVPRDVLKKAIQDGVAAISKAQGLGRKAPEQVVADVGRHFAAIDQLLEGRSWLVGDSLSVADLAVISQVSALLYAVEAREILKATTNVEPWMERVNAAAPSAVKEA
ncbi:MAG TPA: glutathione S-transferase family protein [Caulobacteraceae bacterium]|nr:glutathione S-transferase family protein [Caulobacteraceae bacterium]